VAARGGVKLLFYGSSAPEAEELDKQLRLGILPDRMVESTSELSMDAMLLLKQPLGDEDTIAEPEQR
jgi:hypothetical protein